MTDAGISIVVKKTKIGTRVMMRECGNLIMYAPMTPAIAPLAPRVGTREYGFEIT